LTQKRKPKQKKKKKRSVLARAVPGNSPDGQTDKENKTPKQQNKTKQKKKKKKVRVGSGSARKLPKQFTTNRLASSADHR
jgi:hypothetical protein